MPTQEAIIGRRKADSAEFDPPPPTSHVKRTDQDAFGKIFRRNIAYGTVASHGTIFVGFSAQQRIRTAMLESMIGAETDHGRAHNGHARHLRCVLRHPVRRPAGRARRG